MKALQIVLSKPGREFSEKETSVLSLFRMYFLHYIGEKTDISTDDIHKTELLEPKLSRLNNRGKICTFQGCTVPLRCNASSLLTLISIVSSLIKERIFCMDFRSFYYI